MREFSNVFSNLATEVPGMMDFGDSEPYKELTSEGYISNLVKTCDEDRAQGRFTKFINEGDRLADEFRRQFPSVPDKDLGTLLIVFTKIIAMMAHGSVFDLADTLETTLASYSYCAAAILKGVIELKDM